MTIARKTIAATLAAVILGVAMLASAAPASARGFHRSYGYHRHWGPGLGLAAGALALGAIAAGSTYYGDCYITRRPVRNYYGNVVGWRRVRVCN